MTLSVHAIYRLAPTRKTEVRPEWFTQRSCLRSFQRAVEATRSDGIPVRTTVIVDGVVDDSLEADLGWFDDHDRIALGGNSLALRHALEVSLRGTEFVVLFAEDDYLWTDRAILETVRLLAADSEITYASPYAHPIVEDSKATEVRRHRQWTRKVGDVAWRSSPRTTMTFACRTATLRAGRHYWWLASYGKSPKDSYAFWALLEGRWFKLVGNAAFRDYQRVANVATIRLVVECVARRYLRCGRGRLAQPVDGLATHLHRPFITGSTDWGALAAATDQQPT